MMIQKINGLFVSKNNKMVSSKTNYAQNPHNNISFTSDYDKEEVIRVHGYDTPDAALLRDYLRTRLLRGIYFTEEQCKMQLNNACNEPNQLDPKSKYYPLGMRVLNKRTSKYMYIFNELKDMPDFNGLRGKTPLFDRGGNGLDFRLKKLKDNGIKTIIDLRSKGECSTKTLKKIHDNGLNYLNFPVHDLEWTSDSLSDITAFIEAVNEGDFIVGCANGQARTDLAVAINYILNPKSKNAPDLYFDTPSSTRVSITDNMKQIYNLVKKNPDIVYDWGWNSYDEFLKESSRHFCGLINKLSANLTAKLVLE